jgi:hypothetical protein
MTNSETKDELQTRISQGEKLFSEGEKLIKEIERQIKEHENKIAKLTINLEAVKKSNKQNEQVFGLLKKALSSRD